MHVNNFSAKCLGSKNSDNVFKKINKNLYWKELIIIVNKKHINQAKRHVSNYLKCWK